MAEIGNDVSKRWPSKHLWDLKECLSRHRWRNIEIWASRPNKHRVNFSHIYLWVVYNGIGIEGLIERWYKGPTLSQGCRDMYSPVHGNNGSLVRVKVDEAISSRLPRELICHHLENNFERGEGYSLLCCPIHYEV